MQPRGDGPVRVILGTMNFGARTSAEESRAVLARALERGVTHWDTANAYAEGASEVLVGEALRAHRERGGPPAVHLATKVGIGTLKGPAEGLAPQTLTRALEASLRRLGVPRVDLYYLHKPDPETPIAETLRALAPALADGRVGTWGLSNFSAWRSLEVLHAAEALTVPRPIVGQMIYNVLVRDLEHEYLAFAQAYGLQTAVYNPLAGGLLAGHHRPGTPTEGSRFAKNPLYQRRYWSDRLFAVVDDLRQVAAEAGLSLLALAYRWLAGARGVDAVLVGPASVRHLDEALDALAAGPLPRDVARAVDEVHRAYRGTDARYAR